MPVCKQCGDPIDGRRPHAIYCSNRCRVQVIYERRRAAEDLLRRQLEAIRAGDTDAVVDTIQEAERTLLG